MSCKVRYKLTLNLFVSVNCFYDFYRKKSRLNFIIIFRLYFGFVSTTQIKFYLIYKTKTHLLKP